MINLKQCPFCGNEARIKTDSWNCSSDSHGHFVVIRCDSCDFEFPKKPIEIRTSWDASEFKYVNDMAEFNKAVELWNKRADMRGETT